MKQLLPGKNKIIKENGGRHSKCIMCHARIDPGNWHCRSCYMIEMLAKIKARTFPKRSTAKTL